MGSENIPAGGSGEQDTTNDPQTEMEVLDSADDVEEVDESTEGGDESTETETPDESDDNSTGDESDESEEGDTETEETDDTREEPEDEFEETEGEDKIAKPGWQALKAKHPDLAKDKDFKHFYFKASELIDLFPTVDDAKKATEKAESYDILDRNLGSGDLIPVLKDINKEALEKLADGILPALGQVNIDAYKRATRPLIIDIMNNVYEYGVETKNEILQKSIRNVCKFLTGDSNIPARVTPVSQTPEVKAEVDRLRSLTQQQYQRDETKFLHDVDRVLTRKMYGEIVSGIDPKNELKLSPFIKQAIIDKTMKEVFQKMSSDPALETSLKRIKGLAARAAFADQYKSRMVSAALDRAKKLIPAIRAKHKAAAIGKQPTSGNGKIVAENKETMEVTQRTTSGKKVTSVRNQVDTNKTSELDFLNDRITLKG